MESQSEADIRVSEGPEGPQRTSGGAAPDRTRAAHGDSVFFL